MRILQILPELNVGGVETGTVDFAKYLTEGGHHAVVVSSGGTLVAELERAKVKHYSLPVHKKSLWTTIGCINQLKKIILDEKIDIVHARSRVPAWIAYFACRQTEAKFITTCHGHYSNHLLSRVMGWPKLIIVPSEVIGRHMIDTFGVPPENIRVIARSVDLKRFVHQRKEEPGQSRFVVAMVGRITALKGHSYFLKAMSQLVRSQPFIKIWIIGDAPRKKESYRQELEILVRRLGLSDFVEFLGNRSDVPQLLAQTDCLVMSSIVPEAFGRVILEAQAAGVPVVATKVGGVVEIIDDEKTGLLVLPKDTEAMAKAVARILNDRKLVQSMVAFAKKKLETKYTLDQMCGQTIKVYEELLKSTNILVIKLSSIGDVVLVTASLKAIRQKYPQANIYCLVGKDSTRILQRCPYIDGMIIYDDQDKDKGFNGLLKLSQKLRQSRFDMVIDFQNNQKSHLLSFLSFPIKSFGYRNKKFGFLLSQGVSLPTEPLPPVEHQFRILKNLGIEYQQPQLELWPSGKDIQYAQELFESEWLGNAPQIVGINISASQNWPTKNWPVKSMAKLCDLLNAKNIRVLITGMNKDLEKARELLGMTKTKPAVFIGKTDIPQLAALIKRCGVFITPDSAPLHIAAAMQVPTIALFGPTDSRRHIPPAARLSVIEKKPACAPCYSSKCRMPTHMCMNEITPEEVLAKVEELLHHEHPVSNNAS